MAFKRKDILTQAVTWVDPGDSTWRDRRGHEKTNPGRFYLCEVPQMARFITRKQNGGGQGLGERGRGVRVDQGVSDLQDEKKFWKWMVGTAAQHYQCI